MKCGEGRGNRIGSMVSLTAQRNPLSQRVSLYIIACRGLLPGAEDETPYQ